MSNQNGSNLQERFQNFFNGWLERQQSFLDQLDHFYSSLTSHENHLEQQRNSIIEQVLSHYQEYYEEKARAALEDVFTVFSAPWLSSFERTFLWIGGFKPSMILRLVNNILGDLTPEQLQIMERMKAETSQAEKELMETTATVQESLAAPPLLTLARRVGRLMGGEILNLDGALERVKTAMLGVLQSADGLRASTVRKLVEVLSPDQKVRFLMRVAQFQLSIRRWGVQRDSQRATSCLSLRG
ncbi:protein ZW2 [Ziziphus jujuba]|uniref:Protein ZW2 n=2 Tax=Ziziphus jujuba TaxID=326968 RepID=A0A6P3ZWI1_ZIZJJ|nr:protein ZW2 [Ziziphus jujuba]KAH7524827.1 hypothetical protein FEM48_Zijuj06G0160400 [Ziziphus jujuba var. spinosa]